MSTDAHDPPSGCDYIGHEFGASYPDSLCIEGYLWDADSCDEPGGALYNGGELPCPRCNTRAMLERAREQVEDFGVGYSMPPFSPHCGGAIWRWAIAKALKENEAAAIEYLGALEPFEVEDWPDEAAVFERRASYKHVVKVLWTPDSLPHTQDAIDAINGGDWGQDDLLQKAAE